MRILLLTSVLVIALGGCANGDPGPERVMYPHFGSSQELPATMSCEEIDGEIRKTDSIRWSMQEDGLEPRTSGNKLVSGAAGSALAVLIFPVDPINATLLGAASVARFGEDVVTAADSRLRNLMQLKQINNCPATATANSEQTDLQVYTLLMELQLRYDNDEVSESTYIREKTRLLDGLFPVGTVSGAQ